MPGNWPIDAHQGSPDGRPGESSAEESEKERRVLVVEDEPDALEAVIELLEDEGHKTLKARHGAEALDLLREGWRPALILLDLKMLVMDGVEFLQRIGSDPDLADIPVAIVTASPSSAGVLPRRNDAGLFRKPVDYERLLKVVRLYCG